MTTLPLPGKELQLSLANIGQIISKLRLDISKSQLTNDLRLCNGPETTRSNSVPLGAFDGSTIDYYDEAATLVWTCNAQVQCVPV